jgi:hypothetical protein
LSGSRYLKPPALPKVADLQRIFVGYNLPGFATLAVGLFFLGGLQLICLGILGEYIGRIHEVKQRPPYIIEHVDRNSVEKKPTSPPIRFIVTAEHFPLRPTGCSIYTQ